MTAATASRARTRGAATRRALERARAAACTTHHLGGQGGRQPRHARPLPAALLLVRPPAAAALLVSAHAVGALMAQAWLQVLCARALPARPPACVLCAPPAPRPPRRGPSARPRSAHRCAPSCARPAASPACPPTCWPAPSACASACPGHARSPARRSLKCRAAVGQRARCCATATAAPAPWRACTRRMRRGGGGARAVRPHRAAQPGHSARAPAQTLLHHTRCWSAHRTRSQQQQHRHHQQQQRRQRWRRSRTSKGSSWSWRWRQRRRSMRGCLSRQVRGRGARGVLLMTAP